jgi:hypothetical protein
MVWVWDNLITGQGQLISNLKFQIKRPNRFASFFIRVHPWLKNLLLHSGGNREREK